MEILKRNYVKYAVTMCGVLVLCLTFLEISGNNTSFEKSPLVAVWTFIAPFIIWFFGINAKKKSQKGKLTFKQGLIEGFKISLAFGIISPFVFLFYYLFINPDIVQYVKTAYGLNNQSNMIAIMVDMTAQFFASIIGGTVYSAIISFILKTRKK